MRRLVLSVALLASILGCSRSELLGATLDGTGSPLDASASADAPATTDVAQPHDGSSAPPSDATTSGDVRAPDAGTPDAPHPPGEGGTTGGCGPLDCTGCCLPDGTCLLDFSEQACGTGGVACVACPEGWFCKGTCAREQDNCGPANCAGCCAGPGICAAGDTGNSCGHGAQQCQRCLPTEGTGTCVASAGGGGTCSAFSTCDPSNCTGCCSGSACLVGDTDVACGAGGLACESCSPAETCGIVGNAFACAPLAPCDPSTCAGCCDGQVCAEGDQDVACGTGGVACASCSASGQTCTQGACH